MLDLPVSDQSTAARVDRLHREAFIFDSTLPSQGIMEDEDTELANFYAGGLRGAFVGAAEPAYDFMGALGKFDRVRAAVERHSDKFRMCRTVAEMEKAREDGVVGLAFHIQESKVIGDSLQNLRSLYHGGLRVFQLTYNTQNYVGTGCCERFDTGLSYFGLKVVEECNRLGIIIDLSHCAFATCWDAIRHSKAPVALTHSNSNTLCPAGARNKPDEIIKAVADTGGVVGMTFFPSLVKRKEGSYLVVPSTIEDVLDHIDHLVSLVGAEHVGWGSDMPNLHARTLTPPATSSIRHYRPFRPDVYGEGPTDRYDPYPTDLDQHTKLKNLTAGLVRRGYSDADIMGIMGGNWVRLARQIWGG